MCRDLVYLQSLELSKSADSCKTNSVSRIAKTAFAAPHACTITVTNCQKALGWALSLCVCVCVRMQPKALDHSSELFESADTNKDDKLTLAELRQLMSQASKQYSHLEEHARFLDA